MHMRPVAILISALLVSLGCAQESKDMDSLLLAKFGEGLDNCTALSGEVVAIYAMG